MSGEHVDLTFQKDPLKLVQPAVVVDAAVAVAAAAAAAAAAVAAAVDAAAETAADAAAASVRAAGGTAYRALNGMSPGQMMKQILHPQLALDPCGHT